MGMVLFVHNRLTAGVAHIDGVDGTLEAGRKQAKHDQHGNDIPHPEDGPSGSLAVQPTNSLADDAVDTIAAAAAAGAYASCLPSGRSQPASLAT